VWEVGNGKLVGRPLQHKNWVNSVAWSPDGKYVLTGSEDNIARVWEASSGKPVAQLLEHKGPVKSVAWSPDGKYVLTGSRDSTARLWPIPAPVKCSAPQIALWLSVRTGLELDESGAVRVLDATAWQERRQQFKQLGGPPFP